MTPEIFNPSSLHELKQLDTDMVNEIIDYFFAMVPKETQAMKEECQQKNFDSIRKRAHSMKSSSANLGGMAFSALCLAIEHNIEESQFGSMIDALTPAYEQLKPHLEKEKSN